MSKIVLNEATTPDRLSVINANFQKIEEALNDKVLYRDNPSGTPNEMDSPLDMNGKRIYNLPAPQSDNDAARLKDVQQAISGLPNASIIPFTPTANISANNVQGAIVESDTENRALSVAIVSDLASTVAGKGAALSGFKQTGTGSTNSNLQVELEAWVTPEQFGANGVDDTAALQAFFNQVAAGRPGRMQPRTYKYSRAVNPLTAVAAGKFVLDGQGATIQCTAYPSLGNTAIIDFVNIRAVEVQITRLSIDGGWQLIGNRVNGYAFGLNRFNYMHGLALSADRGFVDELRVHDVEGIGFTAETAAGGLSNVQIGRLRVDYNWMIGADFRSTGFRVENIAVGTILCHNNGTRGGGWVGVNFGDNNAAAGTRRVSVGSIVTYSGGGSGVGVGQYGNPANGDVSGAQEINIDNILTHSNAGSGIEIYASLSVKIGSIMARGNAAKGVYINRSDTNNLFGDGVQIGQITAQANGQDGVLVSGANNVQIGRVIAFDNGTTGAGFSGCVLYAASLVGFNEGGHVQIDSIRVYDTRAGASRTQDYGLSITNFGAPQPFQSIGSLDASNNKVADIGWRVFGQNKTVEIAQASYTTIEPSYAANQRVLQLEGGVYKQKWRTTNATPASTIVARPTPGQDCLVEATATGRNAGGSVYHYARELSAFRWNGTGWTKIAALQSLVNKTGSSDFAAQSFGTAISADVVGIAATTLDWDVSLRFSSGVDRDFSI